MAEAVGAIASVLAIGACGVKLSRVLYQMTTKTVHAQDQINTIAMNISLFSSTLTQLGRVLKETEFLQTDDLLFTVRQVVDRCQGLFDEITRLATLSNKNDKDRNFNEQKVRKKMLQQVKFFFNKPTVEHLLAEVEYLKTTLSVILNTLNLATMSATHKQNKALLARSEETAAQAQDVEHTARVQVETLIVARQIAFVVLNQIIQTSNAQEAPNDLQKAPRVPGADSNDFSPDSPAARLIMDTPQPSTSLVRLDTDKLAFLETGEPEPDESMLPFMNAAPAYVDKLLNRWTRIKEIHTPTEPGEPLLWERTKEPPQSQPMAVPVPSEPNTSRKRPSMPSQQSESTDSSWDVVRKPDLSDGSPPLLPQSDPLPPPPPPPPQAAKQNKASLEPIRAVAPRPVSPRPVARVITNPFQAAGMTSLTPQPLPPLIRTHSVPESDLLTDQPMVHYRPDNHALQLHSGDERDHVLRYRNGGGLPKATQYADRSASNMHFYALPWYLPVPPGSNYQKPYVDSDEESDFSDLEARSRRRSSHGSRRRSGTFSSDGQAEMDIPWRIRLSGTKFFEFIDEKLVGPRTPHLPSEPMAWVYGHEKACTEISKSWVSDAAIKEKRYRYVSIPREEMRAVDHRDGWRILQPLHFPEVQALVDRTATLFSDNLTKSSSAPQTNSQPPKPSLRPPPGSSAPGSPRGVAFAGEGSFRDGHRSPRDSLSFESQGSRSPQPQPSRNGPLPLPPRAHNLPSRGPPSTDGDRHYRERHHSPEDDREGQRRREERRRRQDDDREKRKRRHRSLGTTMAKIGGLAALLDGLEGAF